MWSGLQARSTLLLLTQMKYVLLVFGLLLSLASVLNILKYAVDYELLADFGKGFVWGNGILLVVGLSLILWGWRKIKVAQSPAEDQ